jgi:Ala-tRNA(Pro) deacylase
MQIAAFLADQQVDFESVPHAPAFSANMLAKYLRVSGSQVAKAVLLYGNEGFLLAILPATHRIDMRLLEQKLGGTFRLATDQEMAWMFSDCEWGVVSPFGMLYGLSTLLEDSISPDALMTFESQSHFNAIQLKCLDYERLEHPRRLRFAVPVTPNPIQGSQN